MSGDRDQPPATPATPTPATPPWMANASPMTMPQAMPGQLEMIAHQLARGGYGTPQANFRYLNNIHDPVQTLRYNTPPPAVPPPGTPATRPTPGTTAPRPGGLLTTHPDAGPVSRRGGRNTR